MGDDEDRVTIWMASDLIDSVDTRVEYGPPEYESRSQWLREAARFRLVFEDMLDREDLELPEDQTERERMLEDIARAGVRAYTDDSE